MGALLLQLAIAPPPLAQVRGAGHVHPDQIVRVIDEPHLIGFGIVDAMHDRVDYGGRGLGLGVWEATRRTESRCFLLPSRGGGTRVPHLDAYRAMRSDAPAVASASRS